MKNDKTSEYSALIENGLAEIREGMKRGEICEACKYILESGGKRIRPMLVLLSGELFDGNIEELLRPALSMELFHNFSLIHDDIMDNADQRRGKLSVHKKWNRNIAILAGDAMLTEAYDLLKNISHAHFQNIFTLFNETSRKVCYGQELDMLNESRQDITVDEYLETIELKTAALLGTCLKTGAILAGAADKDAELLYDYGINLGISFQLRDDLLDSFGDSASFGKMIGGDIIADKQTYLMIKLREVNSKGLQAVLVKEYPNENDKIRAVQQLYINSGIEKATEEISNQYFETALQCLEAVAVHSSKKQHLKRLAEQLLSRIS